MRLNRFFSAYFIVACGLLLHTGCQEQSKSAKERKPDGPPPRITFERVVQDFGKVPPNTVNTGEIRFTNTGEGPLKITKVGKCCGVVAKLDKDKTEYAPGESGAVKIEWKSGSESGLFERDLTVHSNDKTNPETALTVKAEIVLRITWEPERLKLFLGVDNAECPKVTIHSLDNRSFSITGFNSTGECITADYDSSVEATKFVLEPKVDTKKLDKNLAGRISVGVTHPDGDAAIIFFDVQAKYSIDQPVILVFNAVPGRPIVRKFSIFNNYGGDCEIESISSRGGVVAVKLLAQNKTNRGYELAVEIMPPAAKGKARFTDVISVNLKDGASLLVTFSGYYAKR
ncbi:MAG: DUF1573 domain-containing protein [Planctomycetota bacterium]